MMSEGFNVRAVNIEGSSGSEIEFDAIPDALRDEKSILWVHVTASEREQTHNMLVETFGFRPLEVEDALSSNERPTVRAEPGSIFLVATAPMLGGDTERYVEVAVFADPNLVVTVVTEPVALIEHWCDRMRDRPAKDLNTAMLVHALLDAIVDGYFPVIDTIEDEIDTLEDLIYLAKRVSIADALALKRRLLEMRRVVAPLREILNGLLRRDVEFIDTNAHAHFQDVYDHTLRIAEIVDMERDILSSVLDAHLSIVSNNLNVVMRTLTVISTVLMTAAFVAGVYGMNFKHMPELDWAFGYPFSILLMVALGALEVWFFKKQEWI